MRDSFELKKNWDHPSKMIPKRSKLGGGVILWTDKPLFGSQLFPYEIAMKMIGWTSERAWWRVVEILPFYIQTDTHTHTHTHSHTHTLTNKYIHTLTHTHIHTEATHTHSNSHSLSHTHTHTHTNTHTHTHTRLRLNTRTHTHTHTHTHTYTHHTYMLSQPYSSRIVFTIKYIALDLVLYQFLTSSRAPSNRERLRGVAVCCSVLQCV